MPLPGWDAVMMHVPAEMSEAVLLETVQTEGVEEVKLTGKPELAAAVRAREAPTDWLEIGLKVMACARRKLATTNSEAFKVTVVVSLL